MSFWTFVEYEKMNIFAPRVQCAPHLLLVPILIVSCAYYEENAIDSFVHSHCCQL